MKKKMIKGKKQVAKKPTVRKRSAVALARSKGDGIPVGYSIFKSDRLPTRAVAYDKRNGLQVLLHNKKYIPKWVRDSLTDDEISRILVKK